MPDQKIAGSGEPVPAVCEPGDWVEIERVLLEPADRAPGLPKNTAATPLRMWVKGFALAEASIGDELEVETMTGRVELGVLVAISPGYTHTFGDPPRELVSVGRDLRGRLVDWRSAREAGDE